MSGSRIGRALVAGAIVLLTTAGGGEHVAAAARSDPPRYALIIANNNSLDSGVKPLRYADDDGVRYDELFRLVGFRTALFTVLDDESARLHPQLAERAHPPRAADIFATLARWNREMAQQRRHGASPELVVVYAGHGDRDSSGEGYVNLLDRKLRRRDLYQRILRPSKAAYVHLIIDACKSYYLVNQRGGWSDDSASDDHDAEIRAFLARERLSAYPNAGVILATSGDEATHEWRRYRAGILSHELRSGLTGAADINGDGRVEYSELHAFIAAANARVSNPQARLRIFARAPTANRHRPLVDLRDARAARLVRFGRKVSGRFHLEDDRGVRFADFNKPPGIRFDLVVDRRRTLFVRGRSGELTIAPGRSRVYVARRRFSEPKLAARSSSLARSFRRDLYRLAYSRGFYDGFCAQTGHVPVRGGAVEFRISRASRERRPHRHRLLAGYVLNGSLLDLDGVSHGVQLAYGFGIHRFATINAQLQYGRSTHGRGGETFVLHRIAALVGTTARFRPWNPLELRAELNAGYQGYFGSGPVVLLGRTLDNASSSGFRLETGGGAAFEITQLITCDVRGGLALDVVSFAGAAKVDPTGYFAAALGVSF